MTANEVSDKLKDSAEAIAQDIIGNTVDIDILLSEYGITIPMKLVRNLSGKIEQAIQAEIARVANTLTEDDMEG